jgi:hypothetical protein
MEKITIKNTTYKIPTNWDEVTVLQLFTLTDFMQSLNEDDEMSDDILYSNLLHILIGVPKNTYLKLSMNDALLFKNALGFITTTKIKEETFLNKFAFDKYVIKFKNFEELNFGEYIDVTSLATAPSTKSYIKLMSVLCDVYLRKDIKKFRFKDKKLNFTIEEKEDIVSSLPAAKGNAIIAFFLHGQKQLGKDTASYFNRMAFRLAMKVFLQTVGLTISGLWTLVMRTLRNLVTLRYFRTNKSSLT